VVNHENNSCKGLDAGVFSMTYRKNRSLKELRVTYIGFFIPLAFLLLLALCGTAAANPPASVELSYNQADNILQFTILHIVQDPSTHYVKTVEVRKNGQLVLTEDYTRQPYASSPFTYSYSIPAAPGDTLEATAICNIQGSRSNMIVVSGTPATSSASPSEPVGTTVPTTTRAGLSLVVPFAALAGAGVALFFRRD